MKNPYFQPTSFPISPPPPQRDICGKCGLTYPHNPVSPACPLCAQYVDLSRFLPVYHTP